jgi:hypothetical protein
MRTRIILSALSLALLATIVALSLALTNSPDTTGFVTTPIVIAPGAPPARTASPAILPPPSSPTSPVRGVRLGQIQEIPVWGVIQTGGLDPVLSNIALQEDTLVASAQLRDQGQYRLVMIDLDTGTIRMIGPYTSTVGHFSADLHVSGSYVAWNEYITGGQVHVYDLLQDREILVRRGLHGGLEFKDSLLVWVGGEPDGRPSGIYGYDLITRQSITVTQGNDATLPRICSREWIVDLENIRYGRSLYGSGAAEVHAYNLVTHEAILIGQVGFPAADRAGQQHAVVWIAGGLSGQPQHIYSAPIIRDP